MRLVMLAALASHSQFTRGALSNLAWGVRASHKSRTGLFFELLKSVAKLQMILPAPGL